MVFFRRRAKNKKESKHAASETLLTGAGSKTSDANEPDGREKQSNGLDGEPISSPTYGRPQQPNTTKLPVPGVLSSDDDPIEIKRSSSSLRKNGGATPLSKTLTLGMLPLLIGDLLEATRTNDTSGEEPARALRMLFALSEHSAGGENRIRMVREANGRLVPTLLEFLQQCDCGSSEQYLALLVLNNVSIPSQNKRSVALEHGGAKIASRLLCEDPSCHLMAIILVNLTFADADLRRELVSRKSHIDLIESLSFTLRVASMTQEEYEARQPLVVTDDQGDISAKRLIRAMMDEDARLQPPVHDLDFNHGENILEGDLLDPSEVLYPETARWCLSAIKNLTRPTKSQENRATTILVESGIVPLLLRFVTVGGPNDISPKTLDSEQRHLSSSNGSSASPVPADPTGKGEGRGKGSDFINSPALWDSNSSQDAALFVVMNITATDYSREAIREEGGVEILSMIAEFRERDGLPTMTTEESQQLVFQCVKARMALGYLVGSEGHFGQPRQRITSAVFSDPDDSVLLLSAEEVKLLIEIFADTLHQRARDGPGGYSAATFNVKMVLFAIRCLLTHSANQERFATSGGIILNTLLMKALAHHAMVSSTLIDDEAAEHAAFSLYLQSNYGFKDRFLPAYFDDKDHVAGTGSLAAKVLTSYIHKEGITPPGLHAAEQLVLRLRFLIFKGSVLELASSSEDGPSIDDFRFGHELFEAADCIFVEKRSQGTKPLDEIFNRPILRSRVPKRGNPTSTWDNRTSLRIYPSTLQAVQHLSFGSAKVRHMEAVDDILIANNIARSANGENTESYNYLWSWQGQADQIQQILETRSVESKSAIANSGKRVRNNDDGPISIFGFRCGPCA